MFVTRQPPINWVGRYEQDETHEGARSMSEKVTLAAAQVMIDAARKHAEKIGVPMNIAVVDSGTNLVAFARMDGSWIGSISISQDKAFTARAFNITTKELAKMSQPGEPLFGINASNEGRVVIFGGGVPLKSGPEFVGAIGASGGLPDQDHEVAEAGAAAFKA
jgi:uncharacterized protein GlcG (DUF336 family)